MGTQVVDKQELLEACFDMLIMMESELRREEYSLPFCDAWMSFEDLVLQLEAELHEEND